MALFVTNTTEDKSVRKEWISKLKIETEVISEEETIYRLFVSFSADNWERSVIFETDTTLEGIQTKASNLLTELES